MILKMRKEKLEELNKLIDFKNEKGKIRRIK